MTRDQEKELAVRLSAKLIHAFRVYGISIVTLGNYSQTLVYVRIICEVVCDYREPESSEMYDRLVVEIKYILRDVLGIEVD